jgi:hypothetical protein
MAQSAMLSRHSIQSNDPCDCLAFTAACAINTFNVSCHHVYQVTHTQLPLLMFAAADTDQKQQAKQSSQPALAASKVADTECAAPILLKTDALIRSARFATAADNTKQPSSPALVASEVAVGECAA